MTFRNPTDRHGNEVPCSAPLNVFYQSSSATLPLIAGTGDELFITSDGTSAGTVTEQWIFNGTDWQRRPETPASTAPGAQLAANACVGSPILVPRGNTDDVRTVGTGGTYATLAAAMANATVVDGTILKFLSNVVDTVNVTIDHAVVLDLNGFTYSNPTTTTQLTVTAALAVIKNGTLHQTKTTNTSIETVLSINTVGANPVFVQDVTIKAQEFGIVLRGAAMLEGNRFEYVGASATNSHRFIGLYSITGETKIHKNTFVCSARSGTTRYSNFIFLSATAGSTWTAPLEVTYNTQLGGDLRQFWFNEALVPTTGASLIVAGNTFNDFNGGIGMFTPNLYNGLDSILVADNTQGADSLGNFKGMFFVDGTGALDTDTVLTYGGNTTTAGALRTDYVTLASDTANIVARKNTITYAGDPFTAVTITDALQDTGLLLQDLKGKRTYIVDGDGNSLPGFGTEDQPYVADFSTGGGSGALNFSGTATPTATGNTAASLGIASLPAVYRNTTTGTVTYIDTAGVGVTIENNNDENIRVTNASSVSREESDGTVVLTTSGAVYALGSGPARRVVTVKNGSPGNVTMTGHIDNVASTVFTIPSAQSREIHCDGATWWIK